MAAAAVVASAPLAVQLATGHATSAPAVGAKAPVVVWAEDFESPQGGPVLLTTYVAADGARYTADPSYLTGCNGLVLSYADPKVEPAGLDDCGSTGYSVFSWNQLQGFAYSLGTVEGTDPATNHALAAFTANSPAAGDRVFATLRPSTLTTPGRFLTATVAVAQSSCSVRHGLLSLSLLDGATAVPLSSAPIDACSAPVVTNPFNGPGISPGGHHPSQVHGAVYVADSPVLVDGPSVGLQLADQQSTGGGNDFAVDDVTLVDVTPTLTQQYTPSPVQLPGTTTATLTYTVTNTTEQAAKPGWSFTETLPAGLTLVDGTGTANTCGSSVVSGTPGGSSVGVTGSLAAGQAACTVTVAVTTTRPGTYTSCAADVTAIRGLDGPDCTAVTFVAPEGPGTPGEPTGSATPTGTASVTPSATTSVEGESTSRPPTSSAPTSSAATTAAPVSTTPPVSVQAVASSRSASAAATKTGTTARTTVAAARAARPVALPFTGSDASLLVKEGVALLFAGTLLAVGGALEVRRRLAR